MTSARVQRKPADPDVEPVKPPPTKHGQEISTDTYIVAKSADDKTKTAHGGECCVQTVRDSFSGVFMAHPLKQRARDKIQDAILHSRPQKPGEAIPAKGDHAKEALAAIRALG